MLIDSLRKNTDKYIEATNNEDNEELKIIDMAAVHEAYQFIIRFIGSKSSANPHAGMTLEQMRKKTRKNHLSSAQLDERWVKVQIIYAFV